MPADSAKIDVQLTIEEHRLLLNLVDRKLEVLERLPWLSRDGDKELRMLRPLSVKLAFLINKKGA